MTLAVPEEIEPRFTALCPEAKTLPLPDADERAAALVAEALRTADAAVIGPGLGRSARTRRLVEVALGAHAAASLVLDADALWALSPLAAKLGERVVLTPHEGEFARLLPGAKGPSFERAASLAALAGAAVVLKGPASVVAAPTGESVVVTGASDVLAQGGSGDVLAGLLAAVMARAAGGVDALAGAVAWHAAASRVLAAEAGIGARRLAALIPRVRPQGRERP